MDPDPNNPGNDRPNPAPPSSITNPPQAGAPAPVISNQYPQIVDDKAKPRRKMILLVLLLAIVVIAVGGSILYYVHNRNASANQQTKPIANSAQVDQLVAANNSFGVGVFNQLVQQSPGSNVFISPTSISMALSMVYNGALGNTKSAMQQTLDYQNLDLNNINKENLALVTNLKNPDKDVTLSIANSLWLRQGVKFNNNFLNTVKQSYEAKASTLDFSSPQAPATINKWVSSATNGKIPTIVNQIPDTEVMYLINAVYFKGSWNKTFDKSSTQNYSFTTGDGSVIQYPLMSQEGTYKYFEDNSLKSIQLPYGKNKRLSMNVYLPNNMAAFLKGFSYAQLAAWSKKYTNSQGTILLPKFKLNYSQRLNDTLTSMGMGIAFQDQANFGNIGKDLKISDVKHVTYINVDETGTEAAAATSVGIGTTSAAGPSGFVMQVDKPFLFTIQDNSTNDILFVGVIEKPSQ
jgi:serine protease inhibitor